MAASIPFQCARLEPKPTRNTHITKKEREMYKFSIQGCTHNEGKILKSQFSNTKYHILKAYPAGKVKVKCLFHWGKVNKDSWRTYFIKLTCSGSLNRYEAEPREQKHDLSSCYCSWKLQDQTVKNLGFFFAS